MKDGCSVSQCLLSLARGSPALGVGAAAVTAGTRVRRRRAAASAAVSQVRAGPGLGRAHDARTQGHAAAAGRRAALAR